MKTILEIVQDITREFNSISTPTTLVTNSNNTIKQFKAILEKEAIRLSRYCDWARLRKEHEITLDDSQEAYAFPGDFDRFIDATAWDSSNNWQLVGSLNPIEWQIEKNAVVSSGVRKRFTIKGAVDNKIFFSPIPGTSDAGDTIKFEYMTCNWLLPKTWVTGTSYAAGEYVSYNGNIYKTTSGGTSGSTAPTHTSGSSSDGGVTWTYYSDCYDKIIADTDTPLLDEDLLAMGTIWRFMRQNGLPNYQDIRMEYEMERDKRASAYRSARVLNMSKRGVSALINNFPDTIQGT